MPKNKSGFVPMVLIVGILILVLIAGAYWAGNKGLLEKAKNTTNSPSPIPNAQLDSVVPVSGEITINGFEDFKLTIPDSGWNKISSSDQNYTHIIKEGHKIVFSYQPFGSALCIYSDNPSYGNGKISGNSNDYPKFAKYIEINTLSGLMRRGIWNGRQPENGYVTETVCQVDQRGIFSEVGLNSFINYVYPQVYNKEILKEMDEILISLRK